ncbi:MAG: tetratricopeptide repeat protein [Thermoanaerobaculales bacterium]
MRAVLRNLALWCAATVLLLGGCEWGGHAYWLAKYDREIKEGTQAIASARSDAQRARAYADRGRGYAEKARYSRSAKLASSEEYGRLFELAVKDHDQAIALASGNAEVYLSRGLTFYGGAVLEEQAGAKTSALFEAAKADFTRAIERDAANEQALDMRGLVHTSMGEHDQAISDFTMVRKINPHLGKVRLAEAYCERGQFHQKEKRSELAIADYEKAIGMGVPSDGCECQPDCPLAWLYCDKGQYDQSWNVVHRAQRARRWIPPEVIERLKKASGRSR